MSATPLTIKWVHRKIADHGGDPGRIVVAGHSAGAHIAAFVALDRSFLQSAGVPEAAIAGWIGLAGPYTFDPFTSSNFRPIFDYAGDPDAARPITYARADAPPALLVHGKADTTVGPRHSRALAARLKSLGASVHHVPLDDVGHIRILIALANPLRDVAPVLGSITEFIDGLP